MNMKIVNQIKNMNAAVERVRIVCYGHKDTCRNITYGSKLTLEHGPDYKDDHNVILARADGEPLGNVIHKKHYGDKLANIKNNDDVIDIIEDGMVVNFVSKRGYNIIADIPLKQFKGLI